MDEACGLDEPLSQTDEILDKQSEEGDDTNDWDSASIASSMSSAHAGVTYDENREFNLFHNKKIIRPRTRSDIHKITQRVFFVQDLVKAIRKYQKNFYEVLDQPVPRELLEEVEYATRQFLNGTLHGYRSKYILN